LREPIGVTYQRAEKLGALGFDIPRLDLKSAPEIRMTGADLRACQDGKTISLQNLLVASAGTQEAVAETYERLRKLSSLGFKVPDLDTNALQEFTVSEADRLLLWSDNKITILRLLAASCILGETLADTFRRAERLAKVVNVSLSQPEDLRLLAISREDFLSLTAVGLTRAVANEKSLDSNHGLLDKLRLSLTGFRNIPDNSISELEVTRLLQLRQFLLKSLGVKPQGRGMGLLHFAATLEKVNFRFDTPVSYKEITVAGLAMCESPALVSTRLQKFEKFGLRIQGR